MSKNIGFITTWLARGAAYVTINYIKLVQPEYKAFIYARGGEYFDEKFAIDNVPVHKGLRLEGTEINIRHFLRWIESNNIDILLFNEQDSVMAVCAAKEKFPKIIVGAYIDYYKENTIHNFAVYDFLVCNTKRHYEVFNWHKQCYYMPWGVDISLYKPNLLTTPRDDNKLVFFHSMGMSDRKGTDILIHTFIKYAIYKKQAKLVIHTQKTNALLEQYRNENEYGIEIIEGTISAPGLYYLGDVYVYPTKLDGLGLTLYESLSCGLPVITTDDAPMNEVITDETGCLVRVNKRIARSDGYYWPQSIVDEKALADAMLLYLDNRDRVIEQSAVSRQYAIQNLNINDRKTPFLDFIGKVERIDNMVVCKSIVNETNKKKKSDSQHFVVGMLPNCIESCIRDSIERSRRNNG